MLKLQYFGHLMRWTNSLEKTLMLERLKAGGEGEDRGWDGWMASLTQWTWVWVNSGSWWWTEKPGVLQSMLLQRVGHDWATELNWSESKHFLPTDLRFLCLLPPLSLAGRLKWKRVIYILWEPLWIPRQRDTSSPILQSNECTAQLINKNKSLFYWSDFFAFSGVSIISWPSF